MTTEEADAMLAAATIRRERLAQNLGELSQRMTPQNLLHEGVGRAKHAAREEASKAATHMSDLASDIAHDSMEWVRQNKALAIGGAAGALLALAGGLFFQRRSVVPFGKKTVPLYAAYAMEDPEMMNEDIREGATTTWSKVRDEAAHIGAKAGETYYSARSRASTLSENVSDRAQEAAQKAREAAGEAREWAARQKDDHPLGLVIVGIAAGAILGVLLPGAQRRATRSSAFSRGAVASAITQARRAYEKAAAAATDNYDKAAHVAADKLEDVSQSAGSARSLLHHLVDMVVDRVTDASSTAAKTLKN